MACRISELVLDAHDPRRLSAFWCEVLGFTVLKDDDDSVEIGPAEGVGGPQPIVVFDRTDEPTREKLRLHIDVTATDRDQAAAAELDRLLDLGATPADVGQSGRESWHVLADPEGNEFCLLTGRIEPIEP